MSGARPTLRAVGPGAAGLFSLALVASVPTLPLIGVFLGLLAPLPLVHLAASGRPSYLGWGWVAVVLAGAALAWSQPWLVAACFTYLLLAALPAVSVELWLRHGGSQGRWLALASGAVVALVAAFLSAAFYPQHAGEALAELLATSAADAETLAVVLAGGAASARDLVAGAVRMTGYLAPALAAMYVQSSLLWLRPRLPLLGLGGEQQPYSEYSSEEWLPVAFAVGGLGWVFAGGVAQWLAVNVFVTVLALYFFHGLAIIHFYLGPRLAGHRWVRVLLVVLALQLPVALAMAVLGVIDSFFGLRRRPQASGGNET